ncbi:MAG: dihydrofolate reductase family protein, partial [Nocardioidaceae bacterium]
MRLVTCSMGVSLDGYIVGPDGGFAWSAPDEEVFRFATDEVRQVGVHLLGRRLYETMLYWETAAQDPALTDLERDFAALWVSLPKVVFSKTLSAVEGSNGLATGNLAEEVDKWRAEPGQGDIAIGGATLAAEAAELGLIDEYGLRVHPVLVGGGTPFSPGRSAAQIWNSSAATSSTVESCTSVTGCRTEPDDAGHRAQSPEPQPAASFAALSVLV